MTLTLDYTLLCDDVRIEMGNKISLMGIFQNIMVEKLPVSLIKFAAVSYTHLDVYKRQLSRRTDRVKPASRPAMGERSG